LRSLRAERTHANLEFTRSVIISDEFVGDDKDIYEIDTDDADSNFTVPRA